MLKIINLQDRYDTIRGVSSFKKSMYYNVCSLYFDLECHMNVVNVYLET